MKILNIIKGIIIIFFFVILSGAYLHLFSDYQITESFTLFDMRYVLGIAYIVVRIIEFIVKKNK